VLYGEEIVLNVLELVETNTQPQRALHNFLNKLVDMFDVELDDNLKVKLYRKGWALKVVDQFVNIKKESLK